MGCSLSTAETSGAKVIFPGGEIRCFHEPLKAAELMLQLPNYFLVSAASLHEGNRISALKADEDLAMDQAYVLLPMKRLDSAVTPADVAALSMPEFVQVVREDVENSEQYHFELSYRLCRCRRSRKPSLETIVEETVDLRFLFMIEN